jgi:hypothetical protein
MYTTLEDNSDRDSQSEDWETLLSDGAGTLYEKPPRGTSLCLLIALIPIISFSLIGFGAWIGSRWLASPDDFCPRHVQYYCKFWMYTVVET